jgi:hypothetical protein
MNSNIDQAISSSIVLPVANTFYSPNFNISNFNPFENSEIPHLQELKTGGIYEPKFTKNALCNLESFETVWFVVPYTATRSENLKYFIYNMHHYLQTLHFQFKYRILVAEQLNVNHGFNKGNT